MSNNAPDDPDNDDTVDPAAVYAAYVRGLQDDQASRHARRSKADARWLKVSAWFAFAFVLIIWAIWIGAEASNTRLYPFGISPGSFRGFLGILVAPLLHGSFEHIVSNTLPALILGTAFIYIYPASARIALPLIWLGGGLAVWLLGRESFHIGASGINYGLMAFLLVAGLARRDRRSVAISMIVFFLYGSMIWGVFPGDPNISFESHLAGAVIGAVLGLILRQRDRIWRAPLYRYEIEEAMEAEAQVYAPEDHVSRPVDPPRRLH